jgi:hypothetical protein
MHAGPAVARLGVDEQGHGVGGDPERPGAALQHRLRQVRRQRRHRVVAPARPVVRDAGRPVRTPRAPTRRGRTTARGPRTRSASPRTARRRSRPSGSPRGRTATPGRRRRACRRRRSSRCCSTAARWGRTISSPSKPRVAAAGGSTWRGSPSTRGRSEGGPAAGRRARATRHARRAAHGGPPRPARTRRRRRPLPRRPRRRRSGRGPRRVRRARARAPAWAATPCPAACGGSRGRATSARSP